MIAPVLFIIYDQPDITERTFSIIRKIKPKVLYVSVDAPKHPSKIEECSATIQKVRDSVDWDCLYKEKIYKENQGSKKAIKKSVTWFLDEVGKGIILEYDCLPSESFFTFASELLERYEHDKRIGTISGHNYQMGKIRGNKSYYFSRIPNAWGWATWLDRWQSWTDNPILIEEFLLEKRILLLTTKTYERKFWEKSFELVKLKKDDTWGIPWVFSCFKEGYLTVVPNENLISNIGFTENATRAKPGSHQSIYANQKIGKLTTITHPNFILPDTHADSFFVDNLRNKEFFITRLLKIFIKSAFGEKFATRMKKILTR